MPIPESVFVADDVDPERISGERVIFYPGTRIMGRDTLIMAGTTLGFEGPVTLDNVFVGRETRLNGGFFQGCVFAGNNTFGAGAHVRGGTIMEEGANAAHTVGLKQTILFPFVTLGSLINFCDCLMAGGTSRKDHSEVGSSFIHFNYTPNQDKATPSMFGNVSEGVVLKSRPVFLGGQGGVVGPCRLPFGSVTAAGTIWRKDITEPDRLMFGGGMRETVLERKLGVYSNVKRIFRNNILYIAGLVSLMSWYLHIRPLFLNGLFTLDIQGLPESDLLSKYLLVGMQQTLESAIDERINRLDDFVRRLHKSREIILSGKGGKITPLVEEHDAVIHGWPSAQNTLENTIAVMKKSNQINATKTLTKIFITPPELFVSAIKNGIKEHGAEYVRVIQNLDTATAQLGIYWLKSIEANIYNKIEFL